MKSLGFCFLVWRQGVLFFLQRLLSCLMLASTALDNSRLGEMVG
jgi:hypothetical protein